VFSILFLKELARQTGIALHLLGRQETRLETHGPAPIREAWVVGDEEMLAGKAIDLDGLLQLVRPGNMFPAHDISDRLPAARKQVRG